MRKEIRLDDVREPVGNVPGRPQKAARARAHLRGERRGGAERGPPGAAGSRRQLQGREGVRRGGEGEGAGGRGARLPFARPALHQDRPRRDDPDDGGAGAGAEPRPQAARPRDARGAAGVGEDDHVRQTRPVSPEEEADPVPGPRRRLPPGGDRAAEGPRAAARDPGLRLPPRRRPGGDLPGGVEIRRAQRLRHGPPRHGGAPSHRRAADGGTLPDQGGGRPGGDPPGGRRDDRPGRRERGEGVPREARASPAWC